MFLQPQMISRVTLLQLSPLTRLRSCIQRKLAYVLWSKKLLTFFIMPRFTLYQFVLTRTSLADISLCCFCHATFMFPLSSKSSKVANTLQLLTWHLASGYRILPPFSFRSTNGESPKLLQPSHTNQYHSNLLWKNGLQTHPKATSYLSSCKQHDSVSSPNKERHYIYESFRMGTPCSRTLYFCTW